MAQDQKSRQSGDEEVRGGDLLTRIAIDCLKCGHFTSIPEDQLTQFGMDAKAPLVMLIKRLVCKECGSRSVRCYRFVEDPDGPPLVPQGTP